MLDLVADTWLRVLGELVKLNEVRILCELEIRLVLVNVIDTFLAIGVDLGLG